MIIVILEYYNEPGQEIYGTFASVGHADIWAAAMRECNPKISRTVIHKMLQPKRTLRANLALNQD